MIKTIKESFDDFVITARIKPALTAVFPLLLIVFYKGVIKCKWVEAGVGLALSSVIISFMAFIVRELGKSYEEKLYKKLGGKPTTIILRFTDGTVDSVAKTKYHKWLNNNIPDLKLPVSKQEEDADTQSDAKYEGAARYLRTYANSHREQFPRVYQELKKYNYWRNIYGCKLYVLLLYGALAVREMLIADKFSIADVFLNPIPKYPILLVLIGWSLVFCLIVTRKTVTRNAFDYAKTLIEIVDELAIDLES